MHACGVTGTARRCGRVRTAAACRLTLPPRNRNSGLLARVTGTARRAARAHTAAAHRRTPPARRAAPVPQTRPPARRPQAWPQPSRRPPPLPRRPAHLLHQHGRSLPDCRSLHGRPPPALPRQAAARRRHWPPPRRLQPFPRPRARARPQARPCRRRAARRRPWRQAQRYQAPRPGPAPRRRACAAWRACPPAHLLRQQQAALRRAAAARAADRAGAGRAARSRRSWLAGRQQRPGFRSRAAWPLPPCRAVRRDARAARSSRPPASCIPSAWRSAGSSVETGAHQLQSMQLSRMSQKWRLCRGTTMWSSASARSMALPDTAGSCRAAAWPWQVIPDAALLTSLAKVLLGRLRSYTAPCALGGQSLWHGCDDAEKPSGPEPQAGVV